MDQNEQVQEIGKYNPWKYISICLIVVIIILVSYHLSLNRKSPINSPLIPTTSESPPPYINPDKYHFEEETWQNQCVQDWCFSLPPQAQAIEAMAPDMEANLDIILLDKSNYKKYLIGFGYPLSSGNPPKTFEDVISQQIPALFEELKPICTENLTLIDSSFKGKIIYRCKGDLSEGGAVIWSDKDQKNFIIEIKKVSFSISPSDDELIRFLRLFAPKVKPKL
ncbi:hypothetical protein A2690_04285 [Candidatus Roizmanbacteria bacterium RIFCSPHIGHO2_01_FULL_39_12b]|uniref:Uncharacterized protein n=1 Tax=Candidatus Roizmanbacteria bacterium RIFCSPHIGHO2_01_FULL_39_12b TaxID=1802030 RepID=A0A1F7GCG0_9BACT|nr:MAG: hypothetical protein A2690_04285 [Candidatus Roizmanbacteria bacterium RIFCSPHIGHO2_01_FULL_39_12b]OGK47159.1 MAG: hypothetical protein A3B46_02010 [Candidatus Roizmanbacteria bacterium RIFCSPLOWO2_01_FULL_39_19]